MSASRCRAAAEGCFEAFCDRQKTFVDGTGCHTELWGRSDAAVLMDNEAIPQEYSRVTLQELFEKHIKPYGFQNDLPQGSDVELLSGRQGSQRSGRLFQTAVSRRWDSSRLCICPE